MFSLLTDRSCGREYEHRYSIAKTNNKSLFTRKKGRKRGFNSIYPIKTAENKQTKQTKNKRKQTKTSRKQTKQNKQTTNKTNENNKTTKTNKTNKTNDVNQNNQIIVNESKRSFSLKYQSL